MLAAKKEDAAKTTIEALERQLQECEARRVWDTGILNKAVADLRIALSQLQQRMAHLSRRVNHREGL